MQITGIICEYNPFHNGHARQMEAAREVCGPDTAVVCVMGGNFVQRGEPAAVNRHARARMAAMCGADLVVELPVPWAIASAERFAMGGVALLEAMGADNIAFGSECGDIQVLGGLADALLSDGASELIKKELLAGVSYASARERAVRSLVGEDAQLLRGPNNILAVEYLKAMRKRGSKMRAVTVPRFQAAHDSGAVGDVASASHIRSLIREGGDPSPYMPGAAYEVLRGELDAGRGPVTLKAAEIPIMYALRTMGDEAFRALPDGGEGLWLRFMRCARREPTLEAVLAAAKTKRYARSRLCRMAMAALLGVTADMQSGEPPYIRVLAVGGRGREALRRIKAGTGKPIITKPAAARLLAGQARAVFELEVRAGDIYALMYPDPAQRRGGEEWRASPAII